MRTHSARDDYRSYGEICRIFGIILLLIGIVLPILTTRYWTGWTGTTYYNAPYLGHGVTLIVIGVVLLVVYQILHREHRLRTTGKEAESSARVVGYCPDCGMAREEGEIYCKKCGKKLTELKIEYPS